MSLYSPFTLVHFEEVCSKLEEKYFFEFDNGRFLWRQNQSITVPTLLIVNILRSERSEAWDLFCQFIEEMEYDMTTKERQHLSSALSLETAKQLDAENMNLYIENVAVSTKGKKKYRVPDLMIVQEPEKRDENGYLLNPIVIAEILSNGTQETDRTEKLEEYKEIESLQEYVIFEQNHIGVKQFSRSADWQEKEFSKAEETVKLPSVGLKWSLEKIYRKIK